MQLLLMVKVCVWLTMRILRLVSPADEVKATMKCGEDTDIDVDKKQSTHTDATKMHNCIVVEFLWRLRLMILLKMNLKAVMTRRPPSVMNL